MSFIRIAIAVFVLLGCVEGAVAKAHCHCKIAAWQASPVSIVTGVVHDFGDIASWNTQIGHDNACQALCASKSSEYFNNLGSSGQASLCAGSSRYSYYAVGSKDYRGGGELPCPAVGPPKLWLVTQSVSGQTRTITIGVNRTLLPNNRPLRVCVRKLSTLNEGCNNAPGNATSTNATISFYYLQPNTNYRVLVKQKSLLGTLYVAVTSIDIHVN